MLLWLTRRLLRSTPSPAFFAHAPSSLVVTVCHKGSQKNLKNKRVKIIKSQHTAPLSARRPPPPLPRWHCPPFALHCQSLRPALSMRPAQIPLNARGTWGPAARMASADPEADITIYQPRSRGGHHDSAGTFGRAPRSRSLCSRSLSLARSVVSFFLPVLRTRSDMERKNKQPWLFN
jgi:hypothetical protein